MTVFPLSSYCVPHVAYFVIFQLYYSEEVFTIPIAGIEGKCEVRKKFDLPCADNPVIFDHVFFCEHLYDPDKGAIKQVIDISFMVAYSGSLMHITSPLSMFIKL